MGQLTDTLSKYWEKIQGSLFPWVEEEIETESLARRTLNFVFPEILRYNERTAAERTNSRLKDEFGACKLRVRGLAKVACHLMFGVSVLTADQLMKLVT